MKKLILILSVALVGCGHVVKEPCKPVVIDSAYVAYKYNLTHSIHSK